MVFKQADYFIHYRFLQHGLFFGMNNVVDLRCVVKYERARDRALSAYKQNITFDPDVDPARLEEVREDIDLALDLGDRILYRLLVSVARGGSLNLQPLFIVLLTDQFARKIFDLNDVDPARIYDDVVEFGHMAFISDNDISK